jgi:hypothetical protein
MSNISNKDAADTLGAPACELAACLVTFQFVLILPLEQNEKVASDLAEDYSTRLLHHSTRPATCEVTRSDTEVDTEAGIEAGIEADTNEPNQEHKQKHKQGTKQPGKHAENASTAHSRLAKACGSRKMVR